MQFGRGIEDRRNPPCAELAQACAAHVQHMHVVRVLWMVPIYAGASWLALRFFHEALYIIAVQRRARMPRGAARRAGYHQPQVNTREARRLEHRTARPQGRWWHWRLGLPLLSTHMHVGGAMYLTLARDRGQHLSALHRLNFFIGTHMEQSYWEFVHP